MSTTLASTFEDALLQFGLGGAILFVMFMLGKPIVVSYVKTMEAFTQTQKEMANTLIHVQGGIAIQSAATERAAILVAETLRLTDANVASQLDSHNVEVRERVLTNQQELRDMHKAVMAKLDAQTHPR